MRTHNLLITGALILAVAVPAAAALSPDLAGWADGPAGFLLTPKESKQWSSLDNDAAARDFIALFWARRDTDPTTPGNQFKAEFEQRVRYADENFATEGTQGALTDRGRVLILLGFPQKRETRGPTETVERMGTGGESTAGGGTEEVRANAELWMYDPAKLPPQLKVKGSQLLFVFYERKKGTNDFILDRSNRYTAMALRTLNEAPEALLLHPDLTEVPKPVALPGAQPATAAHLAWLSAGDLPWTDSLQLVSSVGVADAVHRPLWVHLQLPAKAPTLDLLAGRVKDGDGAVQSTFELAPKALTVTGGTAYELSFPLLPGSYTVELVGAAAGKPMLAATVSAAITAIPSEGTWISPLWAGVKVVQEAENPMGAPFQFGPLHLELDATGRISRSQELSYFGFVVRPGSAPGAQPGLDVTVTIKRDGKRLGSPFSAPLGLAKVADDLWIFASSLNLAGLPTTGSYTLGFTVKEPVSGVSVSQDVPLEVVE